MLRIATACLLVFSTAALAQDVNGTAHHHGQGQMMNHADMVQHGMGMTPVQPGQAAFAAIAEIVELLEADPATDWSKVDIEALRQHLIDMDNVTLKAVVSATPVEGGMQFAVRGSGAVRDSIRRMVTAHAATMEGVGGWTFSSAESDDGAVLTVVVPAADLPKLKALGFIGVMTRGMHHQQHHLMIARGEHPHG
jgi:hypothetical protein